MAGKRCCEGMIHESGEDSLQLAAGSFTMGISMHMMKYVLMMVCLAGPAFAEVQTAEPPPLWLRNVSCRIATRDQGPVPNIQVLSDVLLDTSSKNAPDKTFTAGIKNGRELSATVQHVSINMAGDRFNVVMTLDGKTHLRMNHLDLDIYLETTIDGQVYILHCFR